jgi:hypothetical protein
VPARHPATIAPADHERILVAVFEMHGPERGRMSLRSAYSLSPFVHCSKGKTIWNERREASFGLFDQVSFPLPERMRRDQPVACAPAMALDRWIASHKYMHVGNLSWHKRLNVALTVTLMDCRSGKSGPPSPVRLRIYPTSSICCQLQAVLRVQEGIGPVRKKEV